MDFCGITKLSVDSKSRIAIPKQYREKLAEHGVKEMVITADQSVCLVVYPREVYQEIHDRLISTPNKTAQIQRLKRTYVGHASHFELDGTGRISLTDMLREHANIDRKAVLVGQGNKFEVWDEREWALETERWKAQGPLQEMPAELEGLVL